MARRTKVSEEERALLLCFTLFYSHFVPLFSQWLLFKCVESKLGNLEKCEFSICTLRALVYICCHCHISVILFKPSIVFFFRVFLVFGFRFYFQTRIYLSNKVVIKQHFLFCFIWTKNQPKELFGSQFHVIWWVCVYLFSGFLFFFVHKYNQFKSARMQYIALVFLLWNSKYFTYSTKSYAICLHFIV